MKKSKFRARESKKFSADGANGSGHNHSIALGPKMYDEQGQLEQAIQRYIDLYDFAPIGYVSMDRVGRVEEVNLAAAEFFGRTREAMIGVPFSLHVMREDSGLFLDHLLRCRSSDEKVETELRLKKYSGEIIFVSLSSTPTTSSLHDGARLYQTAIIDLSERKRSEETLRQSQERYRTLFEFVPVAVYTCDEKGLIQEFNRRAVELWGREPKKYNPSEKFCGSFRIFYPDGRPMPHAKCPMACALRGEKLKPNDLEILVEREDGVRRHVLVNPKALKNSRGKIIGAINCLYDITQRKKTEDALRESEEMHRALVRQTAVGMARSNLKGRFEFVNKKFCELLGYKESELLGKSIIDVTHREDIPESRRLFARIVRQGEPYHLEKRYLRKDGSALWVSVSASPMRDARGKTCAAIAVILDISEQRKARAMMEKAKLALEKKARGLEGEILEIADREQRRLGQDLHDSLCQHLTATAFMARAIAARLREHRVVEVDDLEKIAELINVGVTEARTVARGLHPVEMDEAGLVTSLHALLHQQSKVPYKIDIDEEISIRNPVVALHLYRIAREAVINANKHARARELIIRMRNSPKEVELSVTDDGVGLAKNRADGAGMGFHIMDYRARSIGARLEITSIKPHGTRIACYVPRK